MTDFNLGRAGRLLDLEHNFLETLRAVRDLRDERRPLRRQATTFAILGLIICAVGLALGMPFTALASPLAFVCGYFASKDYPAYTGYGQRIKKCKVQMDRLWGEIKVQRGITDLMQVSDRVSTAVSDVRLRSEILMMGLRGKG